MRLSMPGGHDRPARLLGLNHTKGGVANDLAIRALDIAVRLRYSPHGCLFHSDGVAADIAPMTLSRSCGPMAINVRQERLLRQCVCRDDVGYAALRVKSLKAELTCRQKWPTLRQAERAMLCLSNACGTQYIYGFFNTGRRHSYRGGISPIAFEAGVT